MIDGVKWIEHIELKGTQSVFHVIFDTWDSSAGSMLYIQNGHTRWATKSSWSIINVLHIKYILDNLAARKWDLRSWETVQPRLEYKVLSSYRVHSGRPHSFYSFHKQKSFCWLFGCERLAFNACIGKVVVRQTKKWAYLDPLEPCSRRASACLLYEVLQVLLCTMQHCHFRMTSFIWRSLLHHVRATCGILYGMDGDLHWGIQSHGCHTWHAVVMHEHAKKRWCLCSTTPQRKS